ncbi:MAG: enoyl-ACP reductase [Pirellulales bacterium]|nr:enoyl-ACP reductase [Pirellulales bacterium]
MPPLFAGKKGLILGIANDYSIAWHIASQILEQGGICGFSHLPDKPEDERKKNRGRVAKIVEGLPGCKFLHPLDVSRDADIAEFVEKAKSELGTLDFVLHSIAYASLDDLKRETIATSREGFKLAMDISCYSLLAVANACRPLLNPNAALLTLTYFGGEKVMPGYNVMGICKAALDAAMKYLAYDLGPQQVRVNALSAGPLKTLASSAVGAKDMGELYKEMAPLGRNITHEEVGRVGAFLLSEMSAGITGEILHVDAGYNIMGSPGRLLDKLKG